MSERTGANKPEPMPRRNEHESIQSLVRRDLDERERAGIAKYGTPLQPHNGRDPLVDLYQELLDATCYVRQRIREQETDGGMEAYERIARELAWVVAQEVSIRRLDAYERAGQLSTEAARLITRMSGDPDA